MTEPDKKTESNKPYVRPSLEKDRQLKDIAEGAAVVVSPAPPVE